MALTKSLRCVRLCVLFALSQSDSARAKFGLLFYTHRWHDWLRKWKQLGQVVEEELEPASVLSLPRCDALFSVPGCKSGPCCPAADLINWSFRGKWHTHKNLQLIWENRSLEPWVSAEYHPQHVIGTSTVVPWMPALSSTCPHEASSSRITWGLTLIIRRSLSAQPFRLAETAPSPWDPANLSQPLFFILMASYRLTFVNWHR